MTKMQHKLRHIAVSVPNVAEAQKFFEEAFGMWKAGDAGRGVYMTDGVMNVALLDYKGAKITGVEGDKPFYGLIHFGMWVDNLDEAAARITEAGGTYLTGRKETDPNVYYEVKYRTPEGIVFDITESGWKGAVKDVAAV